MQGNLPVGKLPPELLERILGQQPVTDPRVLLGPGLGVDCAVVEAGPQLLVFKTDPITFATDEIGWYAVQIAANDIATTGGTPRWFLLTMLLPEAQTTADLVERITNQVSTACNAIGVTIIGGHSEITAGLTRPLLIGTMIGEVERARLVTPRGAMPGDRILLTKGVPIEAISLLAREFPDRLLATLSVEELAQARAYLHDPGISVLRDAQIACGAGQVTAMHDPTEGGILGALWELAEASNRTLLVDLPAVPIPALAARVCSVFGIDPLATIASGALLLTTPASEAPQIQQALRAEGILCADIGSVQEGTPLVSSRSDHGLETLPRPSQDQIGQVFATAGNH